MIFSAKISRYLLVGTIIIIASIIFPNFYSMLFYKSISGPTVSYSPIKKDFMITRVENGRLIYKDSNKNKYGRIEFENLTPFKNFRQLIYRNTMPDSIDGTAIEHSKVQINNIFMSIRPANIYKYTIKLNPLIESKPDAPDLKMPKEFFRITDEFQFINCASNEVVRELSSLFNEALVNKGFSFPAKGIYGNPSTRKPYDEGYFVLDNNNNLYQIKRVKNKPYVKKILLPDGVKIDFLIVKEMIPKEFYALIITDTNKLFLISTDNYRLIELPSDGYDRKTMRLYFSGNMLYRMVTFLSENKIKVTVTDRDYKIVDTYEETWKTNDDSMVGVIYNYIFPFRLSLKDGSSSFVNFYFKFSDYKFLFVSLFAAFVFLFYSKKNNRKLDVIKIFDLIIILITGLYGLLAVLLVKDEN